MGSPFYLPSDKSRVSGIGHYAILRDFLLILRRFVGLYGQHRVFNTDNGTNFVGAERELSEALEELFNDPAVRNFLRSKGMEWKFQPPRTPHFGGAHESLVRSTKRALYMALDHEKKSLRHST
jgi:transposase InsO family protein